MEAGLVVDTRLTEDDKCESDGSGGPDTLHRGLELGVSSTGFNALWLLV